MNFKVVFTDTAKADLKNIALYLWERSGSKKLAIDFVNELRDKTKILEIFPESGAFPNDRVMKSANYRFLVCKEFLIFYRFDPLEKISYILAVFNSKRDYMRMMRKIL